MLRKILISLHKKPKHVRANFALGLAVFFTGLVSSIWFFGLNNSLSFLALNDEKNEEKGESPFSGLFQESKEYFANVKESFKPAPADEKVMDNSQNSNSNSNFESSEDKTDSTIVNSDFDYSSSSPSTTTDNFVSDNTTTTATTTQSYDISNDRNKQSYQEVQIVTVPSSATGTATTSSDFR